MLPENSHQNSQRTDYLLAATNPSGKRILENDRESNFVTKPAILASIVQGRVSSRTSKDRLFTAPHVAICQTVPVGPRLVG
jgi:hypothetical protein